MKFVFLYVELSEATLLPWWSDRRMVDQFFNGLLTFLSSYDYKLTGSRIYFQQLRPHRREKLEALGRL